MTPLTGEQFQTAIETLRSGRIPGNFSLVVCYTKDALKELLELFGAVTECAFRLNNSNIVLRDILDKAGVRYENTPDGPRKIINGEGASDD